MYDPSIGRWIEQDPIGFDAGDMNLYRYVGNNPTNLIDPSGAGANIPYPSRGTLKGTKDQEDLYRRVYRDIENYNQTAWKYYRRVVNTGDERPDEKANKIIYSNYSRLLDDYGLKTQKVWNDFYDKWNQCKNEDMKKKLWMDWEKNYPIIAGRMWTATVVTAVHDKLLVLPKEKDKVEEALKRIGRSIEDLKVGLSKEKGHWKTEVEGTIIIITIKYGGGKWEVKWGKDE